MLLISMSGRWVICFDVLVMEYASSLRRMDGWLFFIISDPAP